MDPVSIKLTEDDLTAPDFPLPGELTDAMVEHVHIADSRRGELAAEARALGPDAIIEGDPDDADYLIGDSFKPKPSRPLHSTRCVATVSATGKRCRRWAVIGFTRCPSHSGYGKLANLAEYRERVLERARIDLLRSAPYAVEALSELSQDREINPSVRLKASTEILDRVGVRGGTELTIDATVSEGESPAEVVRGRLDRLREIALASATEAASSSSSSDDTVGSDGDDGEPAAETEMIVDAELVLDEDEDEADADVAE